MDITKYIYDYLTEHSVPVVVPDLGCFTVVNKPSEIKEDGTVTPPVKTVKFDSENTEDNNAFTQYLAAKEDITQEQAAKEVKKFYNYFFSHKLVQDKRPVAFEKFGTFSLDKNRNICFEPADDLFKENFGLEKANISTKQSQAEQVSVTEPAQPEQEIQSAPETKEIQTKKDGSLFDTSDRSRFRENTERRRPAVERTEPSVPPRQTKKTSPPKNKTVLDDFENQKKDKKEKRRSYMWVLWVLLIAAGLGAAAYFLYPVIDPDNSLMNKIAEIKNKSFNEEQVADLSVTDEPVADEFEPVTDEPDNNTANEAINNEIVQAMDDATDKRNALNPEIPSPAPQPETVTPNNAVRGSYLVIIASFYTDYDAQRFVNKLQTEADLNCEVIHTDNMRYRVSAASFDDITEARQFLEKIKPRPYCPKDAWIARR